MIKVKNNTNSAEIYIYGNIIDNTDAWVIGADGGIGFEWPDDVRQQLDGLKGLPIDVHIASDGGDVAAGIAIYNMLASHDAPVTVYIDSWAASIASVIAFCGTKIVMPENTFMMIHNPRGGGFGDSEYLRSIATWLDKLRNMIAETYQKFSNKTMEEIIALMDAETWLTATECKNIFGDKIELTGSNEIKAVAQLHSDFKTAPEVLKVVNKNTINGNEKTINGNEVNINGNNETINGNNANVHVEDNNIDNNIDNVNDNNTKNVIEDIFINSIKRSINYEKKSGIVKSN